jgi:hypothetical protein
VAVCFAVAAKGVADQQIPCTMLQSAYTMSMSDVHSTPVKAVHPMAYALNRHRDDASAPRTDVFVSSP